jgi:hypothetical protein
VRLTTSDDDLFAFVTSGALSIKSERRLVARILRNRRVVLLNRVFLYLLTRRGSGGVAAGGLFLFILTYRSCITVMCV